MPAKPIHEEIADAIRREITTGTVKPGDRLPTKKELAARFDCSIQPVDAALGTLEHEGLIVRRQGKGIYVAEPKPARGRPGRAPGRR